MTLTMRLADWASLTTHFMLLSMLSIGGAITAAPDMHRLLVDEKGWLTDTQFSASIAIAQAAPGPNVLFVALMGWNVGLNAGGFAPALLGMFLAMFGILGPSSVVMYVASRWAERNREMRAVRAFKQGMAPIVVALMVSTGWILSTGGRYDAAHWPLWLLGIVSTLIVWRTRIHLLWLLGAGAVLGALGLV